MHSSRDRAHLKKLLDLSDELGRLRQLASDADPARRLELDREWKGRLRELASALREVRGDSPLALLLRRYRFTKLHVLIVLELLKRRLAGPDAYRRGRELLQVLFSGSFEILEGLRLLQPSSRLLASGVVVPDLRGCQEDAELLELRYRLSDRAFRTLLKILRPRRAGSADPLDRPVRAYRNNLAYLMDLRRLAQLYQKRAAKVFHFDEWDELGAGLPESIALLNRQIPRFSGHIHACLEATPGAENLPLVRLARKHRLLEEHVVILVTLVFQELVRGSAYLDAVDLLKLISRSEEDLIRRRRHLSASSPLLTAKLIVLEEIVHDKVLTAEVYCPNQVVDQVLGVPRLKSGRPQIDADSKLEFHKFLSELDSSDDFFSEL